MPALEDPTVVESVCSERVVRHHPVAVFALPCSGEVRRHGDALEVCRNLLFRPDKPDNTVRLRNFRLFNGLCPVRQRGLNRYDRG